MRKLFPILCLATAFGCFLLPIGGFVSGSRQAACLILGLTLLICGIDGLLSGKRPYRTLAWGLIWIGILREAFSLVQSSFPRLQPILEKTQHLSFIFWFCLFSGIGLLVYPLVLPSGTKVPAFRSPSMGTTLLFSFLQKWSPEILILGITILSLSPLLDSGYYWDDAVNATAYLYEKQDGLPLIRNLLIFMRKYIELGRINILSCYYYFLFMIENVAIYKAVIIGLVCSNVLLLGNVAREAGASRRLSLLAMLLIPVLIQFRAYQDPVTGFYGLMQIILLELLLTVRFLLRHLRTGRKKHLILSLLPFTAGLLTYEVCFPFILMIPLIVLAETRSLKKAVRLSIPYAAIVTVCLGMIFFVRTHYAQGTTYAGVAFSLNPELILKTYAYQLFAALPLSFYAAGKQLAIMGTTYLAADALQYTLPGFLKALSLPDFFILGLTALAIVRIAGKGQTEDKTPPRLTLIALGFSFWLLPAVTIAVSQRYQGQLYPGLGYLPVYLEYFGVSLLLVGLGSALRAKLPAEKSRLFSLLAAFALLLSMALNLQNNRKLVELLNREFLYPRQPGERALQSGLLAFLPEKSTLIFANPGRYIWEADWNEQGRYLEFASIYNRRDLKTDEITPLGKSRFLDQFRQHISETGEMILPQIENYHILTYGGDARRGLAKIGHVNQIRTNPAGSEIEQTLTDTVLFFLSGNLSDHTQITYQTSGGETVYLPVQEAWQVRRSQDGILFQLHPKDEIIFETLDFYGF